MFNLNLVDAVKDEINRKLANKVNEIGNVVNRSRIVYFVLSFFKQLMQKIRSNIIEGATQRWPMYCIERYHEAW